MGIVVFWALVIFLGGFAVGRRTSGSPILPSLPGRPSRRALPAKRPTCSAADGGDPCVAVSDPGCVGYNCMRHCRELCGARCNP